MEIVFKTNKDLAAPINGATPESEKSFEPLKEGTELYLRNRKCKLNDGAPNVLNIPGTDTNVIIYSDDLEHVSGELSDVSYTTNDDV